jgi:hypothetical protein
MRLLLTMCLVAVTGLAAATRAAAEDPYTVSDIKVDATAQSTVEAQTAAINKGRDRAWQTLYRRLSREEDWPRQPALDPATLQRLVRSYQVHGVRSSTTRFVANVTYVFNDNAVRRILEDANVAYSDTVARPLLVIPLGPDWSAHTPWTQAWTDPRFAHGSAPLVLPPDDALDASTLAALRFDSATLQDVEPMAARVHASDVYLALVIPQRTQMIVKLRKLGPGSPPPFPDVTVPVPPKTPSAKAFGAVADASAAAIIDSWKSRSVVDFGRKAKLVASLHADSLSAWSEMLQQLDTVPTITGVDIVAMDIGEARVAISYAGSTDQLGEQLARSGLSLVNENGQWWIARNGTGNQ